MAKSFTLINNTASSLPLSSSLRIDPRSTRVVYQITLEIARLADQGFITIVSRDLDDPDSKLVPDYVGTVDPNLGSVDTGGGTGGTGGTGNVSDEMLAKLKAWLNANPTDGSVLEYSTVTRTWTPTITTRKLVIDGGNF